MALTKVNYIDNETAITADQMNAIQDEIIANSKAREHGYGEALPTVTGSTDEEFLSNIEALCAEKIKMATFQAILYPPGEAFDGNSFIAQIWNNITESNGNKFIKIKAHGVTTTLEFQRVCYANEWLEPVLNLNVDAIVEQGTRGVWTYRKWASGIAECWGNVGMTTGSEYKHPLPFNIFSSTMQATVLYHDSATYSPTEPVNGWVYQHNQIILYSKASISSSNAYLVAVRVMGTWK